MRIKRPTMTCEARLQLSHIHRHTHSQVFHNINANVHTCSKHAPNQEQSWGEAEGRAETQQQQPLQLQCCYNYAGQIGQCRFKSKKDNRTGTCCSLYTWTHALIWYFAGDHLVEQHAKAPDINLKVLRERGQLDTTFVVANQPCCRKLLRLAEALAPYTAQS